MNIYLTGFRGSGKTTLGKELAKIKQMIFIDMDELIVEKTKLSIPEIFEKYGEAYFRKIESEILLEISANNNQVVSTGGGIIISEGNREILKKTGLCIYLTASPEITYERIKDDGNRPALTSSPLKKEIGEILKFRKPLYKETADLVLDTGKNDIDSCLLIILKSINN